MYDERDDPFYDINDSNPDPKDPSPYDGDMPLEDDDTPDRELTEEELEDFEDNEEMEELDFEDEELKDRERQERIDSYFEDEASDRAAGDAGPDE
jgi:hypothetical protein